MNQVRHHAHADSNARQRIADAAAQLFAERGFDGTSMQMIADAAQVNKAMLYYYYASKRDLYSAIIESGLESLSALLDEVAGAAGSATAKIGEFARRLYLLLDARRAVGRIIDREMMGLGEGVTPPLHDRLLANVAKLEDLIRMGIGNDEFRPVDPALAARSLMGMLHVFLKESVVTSEIYPPQRVIEHTVELFRRGVAK